MKKLLSKLALATALLGLGLGSAPGRGAESRLCLSDQSG